MSLSEDEERVLLEFEREFTGHPVPSLPTRRSMSLVVSGAAFLLGSIAFGVGLFVGTVGVVSAVVGYVLMVMAVASAIDRWRTRRAGTERAHSLFDRPQRAWQKWSRP